jgi:ribose transport system substrate-binding protein
MKKLNRGFSLSGRPIAAALVLLGLFSMAAMVRAGEWPGGRTFLVGFAQDHMANDWRAAQVRDIEREFARYPFIRFVYTDAGGKTAQQVVDIENLRARGVDLLITSPRDAEAMAPVISSVYNAGIPVILLSRRTIGDDYSLFIGASNRRIARQAARFFGERLAGKGRILVLQHIPTSTPGIDRTEGFREQLANYPGIEIAAIKRADSLRHLAIRAVEEALAEGIEFDAIYAQSDSMATGARIALKQAGRDPAAIPITGIDYIGEAREAIRAGEQAASFTYPTFGREGAEYAIRILRGETVPREVTVDSLMVTRDNVDAIEPIF